MEDKKVIAFHKQRRMFCIYKNKLFIAEPNLSYSHEDWFKREAWDLKKPDELIDEAVRGMIDKNGDICFYIGNNFEINKEIELLFFSHLKELAEKLNLRLDSMIFGGAIKQKAGKRWPARKKFGKVKDFLE